MKQYGVAATTCGKSNQFRCEAIIHLDIESDTKNLKDKILKAFSKMEDLEKAVIAFPALGQGTVYYYTSYN